VPETSGEVVRRWTSRAGAGELWPELCDEDIVIENVAGFPITGPYRGHAGLQQWWDDLADAFEELRIEVDELVELDEERVLTTQRLVGRFAKTGIEVDTPWASVISVRDGKIVRMAGYASKARALRALGLEP
jgi:ketosteroid isomerase-like protein